MEVLRPGDRVLLHGLAAEALNGTIGQLQAFHEDKGPGCCKPAHTCTSSRYWYL